MEDMDHPPIAPSIDELYRAEFPRLVRSLSVVDGPEAAADAVQEHDRRPLPLAQERDAGGGHGAPGSRR